MDRQRHGIKPGFERLNDLLGRLGHPEQQLRSIIVGGTNGKGSTAATLASILTAEGHNVGLFTSPHLEQPGERIQVAGTPRTASEFESLAQRIEPFVDASGATFFEAVTAMAFVVFQEADVQRAVLEVGMGGRLDATNAAPRDAVLITNVALDHEAYLGPTVELIAAEKAGLIRTSAPVFTTAEGPALAVIREHAKRASAPLVTVSGAAEPGATAPLEPQLVTLQGHVEPLTVKTPLLGVHQVANVRLAAEAALALGASRTAVQAGVAATRWPGRMERLPAQGRLGRASSLILDGAHNPAAAQALADALARFEGRIGLVAGFSGDKDVTAIASALGPHVTAAYATSAHGAPRSLTPDDTADRLQAAGMTVDGVHRTVGHAIEAAGAQHDAVLVAGSLFLVADARAWWFGRHTPGGLRLQ
jgi:dihydrofolate synthase/folylpolyglutamate synthase